MIKQILQRSKLGRKVMLFILPLIAIPLIFLMVFILISLTHASGDAIDRSIEQTTAVVKQDLVDAIYTRSLVYDTIFKDMLKDLRSLATDIEEEGFDESQLDEYRMDNVLVSSVYYIHPSGNTIVKPELDLFPQNNTIDYRHDSAYSLLLPEVNPFYMGKWLAPHLDPKRHEYVVSYALPILSGGEFAGIVAIDITLDTLFNEIVYIDPTESSYVFLVSDTGNVISSSDAVYENLKILKAEISSIASSRILKEHDLVEDFTGKREGRWIITIPAGEDNKEMLIAFVNLPSFGGKLALVSPASEIIQRHVEEAKEIRAAILKVGVNGVIFILAIILLIVFFALYWSQAFFVKPILMLKEGTGKIVKLKQTSPIRFKRDDELGDLAVAFNKMASDLKRSRKELEDYSKNLEKLVKQRTSELESEKIRAETANKAKSLFLANMSHELRTPITSIMGYSHLMQRDKNLSSMQRNNVAIINRSGDHLLGLINNVLEISKIESGRSALVKKTFDMTKLLDSIVDIFKVKAFEKRLKFNFAGVKSVPRYILGDENKIRQILINVLGNAIKFTEKGCVIFRVSSKASKAGKIKVQMEVEDTGPGIAKREISKVFKYFEQTETGRKMQKGTGLGLAISRDFLRMMNGNISVKSKVGKGSVFKLYFDVEKGSEKGLARKEVTKRVIGLASGEVSPRILVAEDVKESRDLLVRLFKGVGISIRAVANGKEAVDMFNKWSPHFIWMDIRMPVMNGIEAMKKIRETRQGKTTTIVALTAHALEEEKKEILEAGFDDFVRKPYNEEELFDMMAKYLGLKYKYEKIEKGNSKK